MRLFGLIGFPLGHSRSAEYFNARFLRDGIRDAQYRLFPLESINQLPGLIESHPTLAGLNVTIPFKEQILPYLSTIDPVALAIGAVNVIVISREGGIPRLSGYNTDAPAFLDTLQELPEFTNALVLGTGGAAKSVGWALQKKGIPFKYVSRKPEGKVSLGYDNLSQTPGIFDGPTLVVNATPVGMFPDTESCPQFPYHLLSKRDLLCDLVYNPVRTRFLEKGAAFGAATMNGEEMFLRQAALGYSLFLR